MEAAGDGGVLLEDVAATAGVGLDVEERGGTLAAPDGVDPAGGDGLGEGVGAADGDVAVLAGLALDEGQERGADELGRGPDAEEVEEGGGDVPGLDDGLDALAARHARWADEEGDAGDVEVDGVVLKRLGHGASCGHAHAVGADGVGLA